ncbi:MAG: hypothetical protein LQ342_001317 [Letrouitia transgressa]|nr:MAG: hypothetical protein LQ342_001317 [Letrouitia transgressa]
MWRGGLPLKPGSISQDSISHNKKESKSLILIDSDEEQTEQTTLASQHEDPIFEQEEDEHDESEPYEAITQTLDIPLGLDILSFSFPPIHTTLNQSSLDSLPRIFSQKLVMAFACSDYSVRLLTLPLTPPSHQTKQTLAARNYSIPLNGQIGHFQEQIFLIASGAGQQAIADGLSVTFTSHADIEEDFQDDETMSDDVQPATTSTKAPMAWDILVASHYTNLSGLLLIFRTPLDASGSELDIENAQNVMPWKMQFLASPAMHIEFNPSLYPAQAHSNILIADRKGYVRIFNCLSRSDRDERSWILSLTVFSQLPPIGRGTRKSILDARWIRRGKAIVVLLEDGEWGIWDLETIESKETRGTVSQSPFPFAVAGSVGSNSRPSKPGINHVDKTEGTSSNLIPMTPGTRKVKQKSLFTGSANSSRVQADGGLCVVPATDVSTNRTNDDTLLLWYDDKIAVIPSILTHWRTKVRGSGNLFGTGAIGEQHEISNVQSNGEERREMSICPNAGRSSKRPAWKANVLIVAEHNIIIVAPPLDAPATSSKSEVATPSALADRHLLAEGKLDIEGVDRILTGMTNGT